MPITAFYAGLLSLLFVILCARIIMFRIRQGIWLGDGGNPILLRRMRVQANFAEYVPFALLLMALAESVGQETFLMHTLGQVLLAGRIIHAIGLSYERLLWVRIIGIILTFAVVIGAGIMAIGTILVV